jgi:hypothetical protein
MEIILFWLFGSFFVAGVFGTARKIGFFQALILSLFFSPVIGIIGCLMSPTLEEERKKQELYQKLTKDEQPVTPTKIEDQKLPISVADELKKLKELLDAGVLTQEEFDAQKKKLLGQ